MGPRSLYGIVLLVTLGLSNVGKGWAQGSLCLVAKDELSGVHLWFSPIERGEDFVLEFLHSYERLPVKEHYLVANEGRIIFRGLVTRSVLNGQGFARSAGCISREGWLHVSAEETEMEEISFIMGSSTHADHRILIREREYRLSEHIHPGTVVQMKVLEGPCPGSRSGLQKGETSGS